MGGIGMSELIVIMLIILLLFGAKRLPEIGTSLGKGIREFKRAAREITSEVTADDDKPGDKKSPEKSEPTKVS